jgi:tRNA(fMet)-specific endonuclease VapC
MKRYMLDTNTVSHLVRGQPAVTNRVVSAPMASLCLSSITEGELLFGLAKRPAAANLHTVVKELLLRIDVLPWDRAAAQCYGPVRAELVRTGRTLSPLDMLIGTHARSIGAVLVSGDKSFGMVPGLAVEDWGC